MKTKIFLTGLLLFFAVISKAQLTIDHVYTTDNPDRFVNLSISGLKYVSLHLDIPSQTYTYFTLYNPDHTIFKTISIPQFPGKLVNKVQYISETLFDTDTLIEFIVGYYFSGPGGIGALRVCNENGNILLERDTASVGGQVGLFELGQGSQGIFPNGTETKLMVGKASFSGGWIYTTEIYNLPGQLACLECDGGVISAVDQPENPHKTTSTAFPNPSKEHFNIKYILPENAHFVFLEIYDIQGILVKKSKLNNRSNQTIVYNDELSSGQFIYRITADGVVVTSDKVVITK